MLILAHRGFWTDKTEQNSNSAFERSLESGFGIETDIRDCSGQLVIAHDPPCKPDLSVDDFFNLYHQSGSQVPLALNIKSDGLQPLVKGLIGQYRIQNYFVFDMSVPDTMGYLNQDMIVFTRQSEYEPDPAFYDKAKGVWLDEFHGHWINESHLLGHVKNNKKVCIVSPELHQRPFDDEWHEYKEFENKHGRDTLMICTDFPQKAKGFFND